MTPLPQADFAAALRGHEPVPPAGLRAWNGSDPARRFAVHRNTYRSSLASALEQGFPVLRQLLGADFFRAMALAFVQALPPRTPVMMDYGAGLPGFIETFEPAAGLPYLADVARLEHLRVQSYHAADARSLAAADFQALLPSPERLSGLRLRLHPSLRLLRSNFAVLSLWLAHQSESLADVEHALASLDLARGEDVVVWRPQWQVQAAVLPVGALETLQALAGGQGLGESLQAAAEAPGFDLAPILELLVHAGLVIEHID